uniref:NADH:ubiquinone reductase (H(+)-translocating) n=1 Tax=Pachypsylla venusta TaxID=38123 RepID=Q69HD0_PACVE|nr:NADH dehydrogenase subunit 5 [Pachypsylla venusta]
MFYNSKFHAISFVMSLFMLIVLMGFIIFMFFTQSVMIEMNVIMLNSVDFNFILYLDWISLSFMSIVLMISFIVVFYSSDYLGVECYQFLWLTFMFIVFMLIMIMSPSVLGVLLGWDGLGIVSYFLVIYYQSKDSYNSGFITAASNRLGDSMLILSISWMSFQGSFNFWHYSVGLVFFCVACLTKSAQFPFSAWLPLAMAAPTPISSLVHSSTLVTAGVYMMIRFSYGLHCSGLMSMLFFVSVFTIIVAGVSALYEYDMKRIVALSTLGQLGFMIMILSLGYSFISFFHLLVHALFKSMLFLCAGCLIHSGGSIQDLRKMGNCHIDLWIKASILVSLFSLMGMPFTSGFYSKDTLIEITFCSSLGVGVGLLVLFLAMITVAYSVRLLKFLSSSNFWIFWLESSPALNVSIMSLMILNISMGSLLNWLFMNSLNLICIPFSYKILPLVSIIMGMLWQGENLKFIHFYMSDMLFIMSLTKNMSVFMKLVFTGLKLIDQGWMEFLLYKMKMLFVVNSLWVKYVLSSSMILMTVGVTLFILLFI